MSDFDDAQRYRAIKADVESPGSDDCVPCFTNPALHLIKMRIWSKEDRCYVDIIDLDAEIDRMVASYNR